MNVKRMPEEVAERLTELRRRKLRKQEMLPSENQELETLLRWNNMLIKKRNRLEDRCLDREQREEPYE